MATNHNLKNALQDAGLTVEEFAGIIQVDPKTVGRWISGESTPYPRHRATITKALALTEADLWPDDAARDPAGPRTTNTDDVIRTWAYSTDENAPDPLQLITSASEQIDILHTGLWFDLTGPIATALIAQAETGVQVRILTTSPTPALDQLAACEQIQLATGDTSGHYTLIRSDQTLTFTFLIPGEMAEPPHLLEARRGDGGLYDRLLQNFDQLWDDAEPIIDPSQLDEYRTNTDEDIEYPEEPATTSSTPSSLLAATPPDTQDASRTPGEQPPPRRWPRRPGQ